MKNRNEIVPLVGADIEKDRLEESFYILNNIITDDDDAYPEDYGAVLKDDDGPWNPLIDEDDRLE